MTLIQEQDACTRRCIVVWIELAVVGHQVAKIFIPTGVGRLSFRFVGIEEHYKHCRLP